MDSSGSWQSLAHSSSLVTTLLWLYQLSFSGAFFQTYPVVCKFSLSQSASLCHTLWSAWWTFYTVIVWFSYSPGDSLISSLKWSMLYYQLLFCSLSSLLYSIWFLSVCKWNISTNIFNMKYKKILTQSLFLVV